MSDFLETLTGAIYIEWRVAHKAPTPSDALARWTRISHMLDGINNFCIYSDPDYDTARHYIRFLQGIVYLHRLDAIGE